jgi:hypothetical protein
MSALLVFMPEYLLIHLLTAFILTPFLFLTSRACLILLPSSDLASGILRLPELCGLDSSTLCLFTFSIITSAAVFCFSVYEAPPVSAGFGDGVTVSAGFGVSAEDAGDCGVTVSVVLGAEGWVVLEGVVDGFGRLTSAVALSK